FSISFLTFQFPTIPTSHYPPSFTSPGAAERWCFFPQKRPSSTDLDLLSPPLPVRSSPRATEVFLHLLRPPPRRPLPPPRLPPAPLPSPLQRQSRCLLCAHGLRRHSPEERRRGRRSRVSSAGAPGSSSAASSSSSAVDFLTLCHRLKNTKRAGWVRHGIREPESVVDHMHRMGVMALISSDLPGVDRERLGKVGSRFSIVAIGMTPRLLFLLEYQFAHTVSSPICGHQVQGAPSEFYGARKWSRGYGSLSLSLSLVSLAEQRGRTLLFSDLEELLSDCSQAKCIQSWVAKRKLKPRRGQVVELCHACLLRDIALFSHATNPVRTDLPCGFYLFLDQLLRYKQQVLLHAVSDRVLGTDRLEVLVDPLLPGRRITVVLRAGSMNKGICLCVSLPCLLLLSPSLSLHEEMIRIQ
ncbi:hypothetical protein Taro_033259, partial [Colocasia esculenta]|nr:hypothetical protein [Colocasia esculenta]